MRGGAPAAHARTASGAGAPGARGGGGARVPSDATVTEPTGILARGPWRADQVTARWREDCFEPAPHQHAAADRAIAELVDRGSPSHDGLAARLASWEEKPDGLALEL
jgi:hypothetical protein